MIDNTELENAAVPDADLDKTQAVSTPTVERTSLSANVECPVCRTPNPPLEQFCIDCGFLLSEQPVEVEAAPETPSAGALRTPDGVREFPLHEGENTVGRESADVLLTHNSVSRKHAKIVVSGGSVTIEDDGSTNGTYVDGTKVEPDAPVSAADGAEVRFGNETLILGVNDALGAGAPAEDDETTDEDFPVAVEVSCEDVPVEDEEAADQEPAAAPVALLASRDRALVFELVPGTYRIGRRQGENDIVIPDAYASGRHADITVESDSIAVTDVGSSNGTIVNGSKLEPHSPCEVHFGDAITFGETELVLEAISG